MSENQYEEYPETPTGFQDGGPMPLSLPKGVKPQELVDESKYPPVAHQETEVENDDEIPPAHIVGRMSAAAKSRTFVATEGLARVPRFTPQQAVEAARLRVGKSGCQHYSSVVGMCLHNVACLYGYQASGVVDATTQWKLIPAKYKHTGIAAMRSAPAGAVVFWTGGSKGHGHVGITDGWGSFFGTDLPTSGVFGRTDLDQPRTRWGLTPAGWALPFFQYGPEGTQKPPALPGPVAKPKVYPNLDAVIAAAQKANVLEQMVVDAANRAKKARPADAAALDAIIKTAQTHIKQNGVQSDRAAKLKK